MSDYELREWMPEEVERVVLASERDDLDKLPLVDRLMTWAGWLVLVAFGAFAARCALG